jgi:hypothetical protein
MKHATLQPIQAQVLRSITRDLEGLDESRNTRGVNIGDFGQIYDNAFYRYPSQHLQKLVTEGGRRVNGKASPQAHDRSLVALFNGDLKIARVS